MNVQIHEAASLRRHFTLVCGARIHHTGNPHGLDFGTVLIFILLLLGFAGRSTAASISWTNMAGGAWSNAANWNPNQVPGAADIAWITNASSYTVVLSASAQVAGLELGGGGGAPILSQTAGTLTVGGNSAVRNGGRLNWSGGALSGQLTIAPGGLLIIEGSQTKTLNAAITNRGTIQYTGGDLHVAGISGGRIENEGLFDFLTNLALYGINGSPVIRNSGILRKSGGTGTAQVGVSGSYPITLHNSGLIESSNGVLQIFGSGTLAGQFNTAAGARVDLLGGTFTQVTASAPTVTGAGSTRLTSGTLQLHNSISNLVLVGGTVVLLPDFQNGGAITNLIIEGATLSGTNTVTGTLRWRDGTLSGQLTIAPGGLLIIEGSQTKTLNAAITNRGTIQYTGGDLHVAGISGGRIENEGLFDFLTNLALYGINGSPVIRNSGILRKSGGTGTAQVGVSGSYPITLHNSGLIESSNGVLQIFGSGTLAGQFNTAAGARVDLLGGTFTQVTASAPTVTGAGSTRLTSGTLQLHNSISNLVLVGGTVVLLPDFQNGGAITNLIIEGATLSGTNTVTGTLRWRDGTLSGQLTIAPGGLLIIEGSQTKTLNAAITNRGTIQYTGGDLHVAGISGGRIENEGLFDFLTNLALYGINGSPVIRNSGILRKSGGTGTAQVGVSGSYPITLHNSGLIESSNGVLQIFGSGTLAGQFNTVAGARVDLLGGTFTQVIANAPTVTGAGSTRLTSGTLQLHNSISNLVLVGGTVVLLPDFQNGGAITNLIIEGATLSGTNTVTGTLRWRDGTLSGQLTIAPGGLLIIEGSQTKTLNAAITNRGTIQYTGGDLHVAGISGGRIENEGLFDFLTNLALYGINGSPVIRNSGILRKSGGTGTAQVGVSGSYPITLHNSGLIESSNGVLQIFGSGTLAGQFNTVAGARVDLLGGTFTQLVASAPTVTGAGSTRLTSGTLQLHNSISNLVLVGGTVVLLPDFQNGGAITNLIIEGATLSGTNTVTGTLRWRDGALSGQLTIAPGGLLIIEGSQTKTLNAAITNRGTIQYTGGDLHVAGISGGRIENEGLFDFLTNLALYGINGSPVIRNSGILRKSGGTGTAQVGVSGSYPITLHNSGLIESSNGVLQIFGSYALSNGTLRVAIRSLSDFGRINFASAVQLTGNLAASLVGGYSPTLSNKFSVITYSSASGAFTGFDLPGGFFWQTEYAPTAASIQAIGGSSQPPVILAQPQSRTNAPGTSASFGITASGSSPLGYQWRFNGSPLSDGGPFGGARSNVLTISSVVLSHGGSYSVTVSNSAGTTNSLAAQLVIDYALPSLAPAASQIIVGQTRAFTVNGGFPPFAFALATNNSGASIGALNGVYLAGTTTGVTDTVSVIDAFGFTALATITVQPDPTPRPDLALHAIFVPTGATSGIPFYAAWILTNRGNATASAPWQDFVSLSFDAAVGNDALLGSFPITNNLPAGTSLAVTQSFTVPVDGPAGSFRVIVAADGNLSIQESFENNNTAISPNSLNIPQQLTIFFDSAELREDAPNLAVNGSIRRNGSTAGSLSVNLLSTAPDELSVPTSITFAAGESSISFTGQVQADSVFDGPQLVTVTASAAGFTSGATSFTVLDAQIAPLHLQLSAQEVTEGASVTVTLSRPSASSASAAIVNLSSSSAQLVVPPTVTFAAGESSTNFIALAVNDSQIELSNSFTILANAAGYASASATLAVLDNDLPAIQFTLSPSSVGEGAGPNAVSGTIIRTPTANEPLTVFLFSGDTNIARVPASAIIPAGQSSVTFPVTVSDNDVADGSHSVVLGGSVRETATAQVVAELIPVLLEVTDDEGPLLSLAFELEAVGEGLNPATTALVTRNTSTNSALTVTIASSNTNEAAAAPAVIIPAGSLSASFPVRSFTDGTNDGSQSVTFTVSAAWHADGSSTLLVSDADLPDLVVAFVQFATNALTGETNDLVFRIENRGLAPATGGWSQRIFLSGDAVFGADTLVMQTEFNGDLGPGQFIEQSRRIKLPDAVGQYWVIVQTDHAGSVPELLEANNIFIAPVPLTVGAAFAVTVEADVTLALAGTPVTFNGHATRAGGANAAFEPVSIHLELRGTRRVLQAITDAAGNYSLTFQPLPGEGGQYQVGAAHPGVSNPPGQDEFTLIALKGATPAPVHLLEGENTSGMVAIQNLANVELTGLTATLVAGPTNITILPALAVTTVAGDGTFMLSYTVAAPNGVSGSGLFRVRVESAGGAMTEVTVPVVIEAKRARLVAYPASLNTGMKRGAQRMVEFSVTNVGGLATGPMQLLTPALPWLSVASGSQFPALAPGEGVTISLLLTPAPDLPLGPYTGTLALNASNAVLSIPYKFICLSDALGTLQVVSVDEFTYYAEGSPRVSNAVVRITDAITGTVINTNTGPTGELLLPGLIESFYYVDVSAEQHSSFRDLVQLAPGGTNHVTALMSRQSVRYTWTVVPIEIEDRYTITVETVFETAVPMPVVTIEPSVIDLANFVGTEQQVNLTLRNHGLIAAQNTKLNFPTHSLWTFTPLVTDLGALPPNSSLTIPLTIRRLSGGAGLATSKGTSQAKATDSCSLPAKIEWETPCGDTAIKNSISLGLISLIPGCGNMGAPGDPGSFNSDIWDGIGGGSSGGGGPTELRTTEDGPPIFPDVPYKCDPCEQARFNYMVLHCFPKFIPGSDLYDFAGSIGGSIAGASAAKTAAAKAGVVGGVRAAANFIWECIQEFDDAAGAYNDGSEAGFSAKGVIKGAQAAASAAAACGSEAAGSAGKGLDLIECEYEMMQLEECKGRGPGGFEGSPPPPTGAKSHVPAEPVQFSPFDSIAPLMLSLQRLERCFGPMRYFYGDDIWLGVTNGHSMSNFFTLFKAAIQTNTPADELVGATERAQLLALDLPVPMEVATHFLDRWNRTVEYANQNIFSISNVPPGQSTDFIDSFHMTEALNASLAAQAAIVAEGFANPMESGYSAMVEYLNRLSVDSGGAICARVKVRLDQEAVLTRDAFNARLEISNDTTGPLEELAIEIRVRDDVRGETTSLFQLRPPELTGINAVDGTGTLAAQGSAVASFVLVPSGEAAPTNVVQHWVSGTLRYRQNGVLIALPLAPAPITVLPNPKLVVKYFHERDVFSDDPFTPEIEPAIPYSLAVLVANEGYGTARQMRITSAQPRIVDNEKDLLIDFEIIGSEVAGQPGTPSLTVNLGDINPFSTVSARWLFRSSLQGLFTDYSATFEHLDGLGDKRFSLIDRVEIHEMNHLVQADRTFSDGRLDFLVNDVPDFDDFPDTLHLSSGATHPVAVFTQGTPSDIVSAYQLIITLATPAAGGWTYFRIPDPGNGQFRLAQVRRPDNSFVPAENFWITDRTFIGLGNRPRREFRLHLLDYQPSGGSYTLMYENPIAPTDTNAPATSVNPLPAQTPADFPVTWNGSDAGGAVTTFDLFVSENGGPFVKFLDQTPLNGVVFHGIFGASYAFYTIGIDAAGNREAAPPVPDAQTTVGISNRPPVLSLGASAAVDEGETFRLTPAVLDPDLPGQSLTFALVSGPSGVALHPGNGSITWVTGEGHGPSTNQIVIGVTDNGSPALSSTAVVSVVVRELNSAPVLDPVPGATIVNGFNLVIPVTARDNDLPANHLTFSLNAGAPIGAQVNPTNGTFAWRPDASQTPSTNVFTLVVSDNGTPVRTAARSFTIIVRDRRTDFGLRVGTTNIFHGESNSVPLQLTTEVELRELTFVLNQRGGTLAGLTLAGLAPEISAALLEPFGTSGSRLHFQFTGLDQVSNYELARLRFFAPSNAPSANITLHPDAAAAIDYADETLTRAQSVPGAVIVVNRAPVLTLHLDPAPILTLFGRPGASYAIEFKSSVDAAANWQTMFSFTLTGRAAAFELNGLGEISFLRAVEIGAPAPE